jgi:hypothetical protein
LNAFQVSSEDSLDVQATGQELALCIFRKSAGTCFQINIPERRQNVMNNEKEKWFCSNSVRMVTIAEKKLMNRFV